MSKFINLSVLFLIDIDKKIANANNCYFEVISVDGDKNTVKLKDTEGEKSSAISSIRESLPFLSEKRDSFIAQIANITSDNNKDIFDKNLQKKSQDKDMSMDNS